MTRLNFILPAIFLDVTDNKINGTEALNVKLTILSVSGSFFHSFIQSEPF